MEERLRMCVACRNMQDKRNLVRVVKENTGAISVDLTGKKNGRGAYICRNPECLKILSKQKILNKTFKTSIDECVYKAIEEEVLGQSKN